MSEDRISPIENLRYHSFFNITNARFNGKIALCGQFFFRDVMEALLESRNLIRKIHDHPIQIWDSKERKKLVGRKVFWHDEPAVIDIFLEDQACVVMVPDGIEHFRLSASEIGEDYPDDESRLRVKDTIYSPHIWWWRD